MSRFPVAPEYTAAEFNQITVTSTATTFAALWVTAGGAALSQDGGKPITVMFDPEGTVRYDPEGGTPTAILGMRLLADQFYVFENQAAMLTTMKMFAAANTLVNVTVFQ
jgi:hypothetical protein